MIIINNRKKKILKELIDIIGTIIGTFILSIGIKIFLLPHQLSSGGYTGIAIILFYLFNSSMGLTTILLNIPLFILTYIKLGKGIFYKSLIGTIALSYFLDKLQIINYEIGDMILASIYGGVIVGIGTGFIFKFNGSTGGTELLALLINKRFPNIKINNFIVIFDICVVTINVIFFKSIEVGMYSAIVIYIMGKVLDIFLEGIDFTKIIYIISDKPEVIANRIIKEIGRGITGIYSKGMYTNSNKLMLMCIGYRNNISVIKNIVYQEDRDAFIIISNAKEVLGNGFSGYNR